MAKKKQVNERISEVLNVDHEIIDCEFVETPKTEIISATPTKNIDDQHLDRDYSDVRGNLKEIIEKGSVAIDGILAVASEGESPRAYEVVSQLIKSVSEGY